MSRSPRPVVALLSTLTALAPLSAQEAGPETAPPVVTSTPAPAAEEPVSIVLRQDSVDQVLDVYERWSGRILLRPAQLPAVTFTVNLDKPLPKSEALRALETLLNRNGIGLAPLGERFTVVSQLNLIRSDAPEYIEGSTLALPPSGRIAAKLFTLKFLRVGEFAPQVQTLLNPVLGTAPALFEKANAMLVIESVANLQRIEMLINRVDSPTAANLSIKAYKLTNSKPSDLATKLRSLFQGALATQIGTATSYQPDDRSSQLILVSDPREVPFFDDLIAKLDVATDASTRSEVIFLKNAKAEEIQTLLSQLVTGQSTAASKASGTSGSTPRSSRRRSSSENGANAAGGNTPPATPAPNPAASALVQNAADSEEFSDLLTIVADERTNAIVVAGTPSDLSLVRSLVDKLDIILAQVRIEVVIAEVTLNSDSNSGISSLGLRVEDNKLTGFFASGAGGSIAGAADGTGFATSTGYGQNLSGIISLNTSATKDRANILSVPTIATTHNKEAEIFVGETRPVISGTTSSTAGGSNPGATTSTVTQQEIGITLTVTPLIGSDGTVQLDIEQTVEDVLGTVTIDGNQQPRIGRRTTKSYISARNGEIIVLGGLQRASDSRSRSRLGPIPIIGDLFGARNRAKGRTELIFFLRPTVLTNTDADNVEALKRIDATSQGKDVRKILDARPAAAPALPPSLPAAPAAPAP